MEKIKSKDVKTSKEQFDELSDSKKLKYTTRAVESYLQAVVRDFPIYYCFPQFLNSFLNASFFLFPISYFNEILQLKKLKYPNCVKQTFEQVLYT